MQLTNSQLHHHIIRHFVDHGYPPSVHDLAELFAESEEGVRAALQRLQADHGVVTHPKSGEIWVAHPFSAAPTSFWVTNDNGAWWGNCAWCAMGVASLIGRSATITTTLGGESKQVQLHIQDGTIQEEDYVVHFPVPMSRAWDNVVYTCSTMLLFASAGQVDAWCRRHKIMRGDIQPAATVMEMATVWYGRHLDMDWSKWTTEQARRIFGQFGLAGPIWELPDTENRF